ncbi:MAG: 2-oxo acid dehydrogenase subunit E2 [Epsilonproteobacteria bacterium]|nr:2-oxo acid dehydrogenase subunit E2 [Campylobacterota bacterium]
MDRVGKYQVKPYTKHRRNIELITKEGWRKRSTHTVLEIDVTNARKIIQKHKEKTGEKISFTAWVIKCVAQSLSEHKELNSYKHGKRKIIVFDDVDIAVPIEKIVNDEARPRVYLIRKANEKSINDISKEIRDAQKEAASEDTQILGQKITRLEKFALYAPVFIQKFLLWVTRKNAILKKKHMGTTGVTAIGMKGYFPGWVVPLGGTASTLFVVGGITKKPGAVNNKITICEYLHLTITTDHDIVDGGPLARFVERLNSLMEKGYGLDNF